jgi:hypothetical protein
MRNPRTGLDEALVEVLAAEHANGLDTAALRALHDAATGGPWEVDEGVAGWGYLVSDHAGERIYLAIGDRDGNGRLSVENARLVAALVNALPELLDAADELDRLHDQRDRARDAAAALEAENAELRAALERIGRGFAGPRDEDVAWAERRHPTLSGLSASQVTAAGVLARTDALRAEGGHGEPAPGLSGRELAAALAPDLNAMAGALIEMHGVHAEPPTAAIQSTCGCLGCRRARGEQADA